MSLFGKKEKEEIARLNAEMQSLRDAMPSESRTLDDINREIKASREELARVQEHLESRNSELKENFNRQKISSLKRMKKF